MLLIEFDHKMTQDRFPSFGSSQSICELLNRRIDNFALHWYNIDTMHMTIPQGLAGR